MAKKEYWIMRIIISILAVLFMVSACSQAGESARNNDSGIDNVQEGSALPQSPAGLDLVALEVKSGDKTHKFTVEMARTDKEQARGLMYRTELADNMGMLFPYDQPQILSFWMKNTLISLDLIFIREDGTIANIAAEAEPYSLESLKSEEPTVAVLEIAGGLAEELGIKAGDIVTWQDKQ